MIRTVWRPAIALALVVVAAVPAVAAAFSPGSAGAGDPFFPLAGNGGYDVGNYTLDFDYNPQNNALDAAATVSATATQDLSSFHLDFRGLQIDSVTATERPDFDRQDQELVITPPPGSPRAVASTSSLPTTAIPTGSRTRTSRGTVGSRPTTGPSS